jgi:hypothetical protein
MRYPFGDRVLLVLTAFGVLFLGLVLLLPWIVRSERGVGIRVGKYQLEQAYSELTRTGFLTNDSRLWRSSNIVTIAGTQYHCLLEARNSYLGDEVTLGMTTNHTFIWLRSNAPPRVIPPGYKPPFWGD